MLPRPITNSMKDDFSKGSGNLMADRRYGLALQLAEWGDYTASADLLRQGLEYVPKWPPMHFHLGEALRQSGHTKEAEAAFQHYLALDPEDRMGATIKLSLIGAANMPPIMPPGYVRSLFDQYAPYFEKCLVENLSYRTPELMNEEICRTTSGHFAALLDLGCGTGLAAQLFKGKAARMVGVDIAPAMIEQARQKNIYTELYAETIEEYLARCTESFDLVLSADVFVYIGDLGDIFKRITALMPAGGLFCFSVQEAPEGAGWVLGDDHRYAHSGDYIYACTVDAGLVSLSSAKAVLRQDAGNPVPGVIYVLQK